MKRASLWTRWSALALCMLTVLGLLAGCTGAPAGSTSQTTVDSKLPQEETTTANTDENGYLNDNLPDNLNFQDEFLFLAANNQKWHFWAEESDTTNIGRAIYLRNLTVEDRLGVELSWNMQPCYSTAEKNTFAKMVETDIQTSNEFDAVVCYNLVPYSLAYKGLCVNLANTEYIDLTGPWWPSEFLNKMLYKDQIYALVNSCGVGTLANLSGVFFNNDLLEAKGIESPYTLVKENRWTIETLKGLIKDTYVDMNNDEKEGLEDMYGLATSSGARISCWYYGAGIRFSEIDGNGELQLIANDVEKISGVADAINEMFSTRDSRLITEDSHAMFKEERVYFYLSVFSMVSSIVNSGVEINFGIAPNPKLNSEQDRYYTHVPNTHDAWFIPYGVDNVDCSSAVIECMASEAYRQINVVYYETNLQIRYAPDDRLAQMYDLIRESITFDFVYIYKTVFSKDCDIQFINCIKNPTSKQWATTWQEIGSSVTSDFQKILDTYENRVASGET